MFPTLFALGPLTLRTATLCTFLAVVAALYVFWRKGREEHYEERELFDTFFLAGLVGVLSARISFIVLNAADFGFSLSKWLDLGQFPGMIGKIGLLAATLVLLRQAKRYKWDVFEVLDFWILSLTTGFVFLYLGFFFAGTGMGNTTTLPVGIVFPSVLEPHHPVQLYATLFFFALSWYLWKVEKKYRMFRWYRASKTGAETGFLVGVFAVTSGFFFTLLSFITPATLVFAGLGWDWLAFVLLMLFGFFVLFTRSGRTVFKRKQTTHVTES
ncbi:MAG: prolipoprotein diacylglyceryl transferase [bacterium]|nr:prolipoprotein diacylglyceryl transferase [bacterium]